MRKGQKGSRMNGRKEPPLFWQTEFLQKVALVLFVMVSVAAAVRLLTAFSRVGGFWSQPSRLSLSLGVWRADERPYRLSRKQACPKVALAGKDTQRHHQHHQCKRLISGQRSGVLNAGGTQALAGGELSEGMHQGMDIPP
jgi:hypothetical protein